MKSMILVQPCRVLHSLQFSFFFFLILILISTGAQYGCHKFCDVLYYLCFFVSCLQLCSIESYDFLLNQHPIVTHLSSSKKLKKARIQQKYQNNGM